MSQNTFRRVEIKYLIGKNQYDEVRKRIADYMTEDEYGLSRIQSIYFDTENYDLIRNSLEKPKYKEKLRLRAYGKRISPDSGVFLELKKKYDGIVYKRRIMLPYSEALEYLENGKYPSENSQILREIDYFIKYYKPVTRTYVSYDRLALYGNKDPELRITFDSNIRVTFEKTGFSSEDIGERLTEEGEYLMEIKTPYALPLWLCEVLSEARIYPGTFSKYGNACKRFLKYEEAKPHSAIIKTFA